MMNNGILPSQPSPPNICFDFSNLFPIMFTVIYIILIAKCVIVCLFTQSIIVL